jgi:quercetin dioxygenase-like cupin family protein
VSTQRVPEILPQQQAPPDESSRDILLENEQVLVIESTYPVAGGVPVHTHRFPQVLYVVEGGTVQTTAPDGAVHTLELRPGQAHWRPVQSHASRNIGPTPVRIVEVEVKVAPSRVVGDGTPWVATPADLEWAPDPREVSRKSALLLGDPTKPGPYVVRVHTGAGYHIRLHLHPAEDEHLTVLSGALHWSTGRAGSGAPEHVAPAGSYLLFPAGTPHRLWTNEETVLQMTGIGPRSYRYLEPVDEPKGTMAEAESGPTPVLDWLPVSGSDR